MASTAGRISSMVMKGIVEACCLLRMGADVNAQGGEDGNALQAGCSAESWASEVLLEKGVCQCQGEMHEGSISYEVMGNCELLLEKGADVNVQRGILWQCTAGRIKAGGHEVIVKLLLLENGCRYQCHAERRHLPTGRLSARRS